MKRRFKKSGKVNKGGPSGFMISLLVHAAAFFLAGLLVVFTVQHKQEMKFEPPKPVERPKMKLRKPKVKVKKSAKPSRLKSIVTKVDRPSMPEIRLPEVGGVGDGLAGSGLGGGFGDFAGLSQETMFGGKITTGSDLMATYYDLNRKRNGGFRGVEPMSEIGRAVSRFIESGCKETVLSKYYQGPPLYSVGVMIPRVLSQVGPSAFGQNRARPQGWFVHYAGELVHPTDIRFRFWGYGDDIMVVMVDKKVVLSAGVAYNNPKWVGDYILTPDWQARGGNINTVIMAGGYAGWGDWIDLKAGEAHSLDIIVGESPGGHFSAMLNVEVDGVEYEENDVGSPILPMFRTEELSWEQLDAIYQYMVPGESCLTNGPIFRDY